MLLFAEKHSSTACNIENYNRERPRDEASIYYIAACDRLRKKGPYRMHIIYYTQMDHTKYCYRFLEYIFTLYWVVVTFLLEVQSEL